MLRRRGGAAGAESGRSDARVNEPRAIRSATAADANASGANRMSVHSDMMARARRVSDARSGTAATMIDEFWFRRR